MNAQEAFTPVNLTKQKKRASITIHDRVKSVRNSERYFFLVLLFDLFLLNASILGGLGIQLPLNQLIESHPTALGTFILTANILAVGLMMVTNVFRIFEGVRIEQKLKNLIGGSLIYFGIFSLLYYQFFYPVFEVHFLLPSALCFMLLASLIHYALDYYNQHFMTNYLTYAVIGGESSNISFLEKAFKATYGKRTICVGRFGNNSVSGVNSLGGYNEIKAYLQQHDTVNKLLYVDGSLPSQDVQDIVQICRNHFVDFEIVPQAVSFLDKGVKLEQLPQLPVFRRKKEPLCALKNRILKRSFDIVFSLGVILFVYPWLLPIIAILVKLESPGPIFFKQKRSGYWNKPFNCIKFRSMRLNKDSDQVQATRSDKRITKIGSFLRKSNLDEFPQFINVLKGDMSVVGPRPHMLKHTEDYSKLIDTFMIRHAVKPGVTGWAQVNGWRGPTEEVYQMAKRVEFDVEYIENWSFWLDIKCIFLTMFNVFKGEKNAF